MGRLKFFVYPLVAILAGVIAAWFGLGGAVKGPLMELGLLPAGVVVATSSATCAAHELCVGYIMMQRLLMYYDALLFAVA